MNETKRLYLRLIGIQFALVVAATHLYWGLPKFSLYVRAGVYPDPRPPLFVASGLLVLAGLVALYYGAPRRPVYAAGILLALGYFFGYAWWHVGDHGGILPWIDGHGHSHASPVSTVLAHLVGDPVGCTLATHGPACTEWDPLALVSKTAELGLVSVLAALLYEES